MCYVLGHVGANKIIGEILCHSGGLGSPNKAPHLPLHYTCTPLEHFYLSKIKEITMEALKWRKSHKRAKRPFAFVEEGVCFIKGSFSNLLETLFSCAQGKRRGTKQGRWEPKGVDCFIEMILFQPSRYCIIRKSNEKLPMYSMN